ncbi:MAG: hypothetical protein IPJ80_12980 [Saprospiraceae bacterium]|nr:hypothetical protein [Saprospiraceae bacterium]MBK7914396.1 hypothetical protein [Saprospiraceae bacterium]
MINPTIIIEPFNYPGHRHGNPLLVSSKAVRVVCLAQPTTVICTPTGKRQFSGPEYIEPLSCSLTIIRLQSQTQSKSLKSKLNVLAIADRVSLTGWCPVFYSNDTL